jgi:hypothetical protein
MKKTIFFSILLFGFLSFGFANALMVHDPVSPQPLNININTTCSVGDILQVYLPNDDPFFLDSCPKEWSANWPPYLTGTYTLFECDSGVASSTCYDDASIASSTGDTGYVSQSTFTFTEIPTTPIITIPGGFIASVLAYAGRFFTDLETLVILLIGLPVGFWVIKKAIALVKKRIK